MRRIRRGFTLIELLIVVAIIGILAAIAVPNFLNAQVRAKSSRVLADLRSIRSALEMYAIDCNRPILDPNELAGLGIYQRGFTVWGQLTTPNSYIAPSAFFDPFVPTEPPAGNAAWEAVMDGVYHYRYIEYMRRVNNQGASGNSDPTGRWYIGDPQKLLASMTYDASNGLRSVGDIMVTGKGILGVNFVSQRD